MVQESGQIFLPFLSQCTRLTDRRADGRTDRILIARPRLHCMKHGKNRTLLPYWLMSNSRRHRMRSCIRDHAIYKNDHCR